MTNFLFYLTISSLLNFWRYRHRQSHIQESSLDASETSQSRERRPQTRTSSAVFSREERRQTYMVMSWRGSLTGAGPGKAKPLLGASAGTSTTFQLVEKGRRVHGGKKAERSQAAFWIVKCFECRAGFFWKAWCPPLAPFFFFLVGGGVLATTQACVQHLSPTKDGIVKDCCAWQMVE